MNILHIGHSAKWRGGENQTRLLVERATKLRPEYRHYLAYPKGAVIFDRLNTVSVGNIALSSRKAFDLRSIYQLIRFCRANNIRVLHAHSAAAHTLAIVTRAFLTDVKLVVHRRVDNPIKTSVFTRRKYLSNKVDKFITVSQAVSDILHDYGVAKEKVELIYDSIDASVYQTGGKSDAKDFLTRKFSWSQDTPLIGFISAIDSQKNPELFVEIIKRTIDRGVDINAVMAGDGKLAHKIDGLIGRYGLTTKLKMLGFVDDVAQIFSALDVFILPSRNEGLGTVVQEAIAAGTVVIGSNVGGIGEVIIDRQTGRLIDPGQVDDYVDAIIELIEKPSLAPILIEGAQKHAVGKFDFNTMVSSTLNVYDSILAQ